MEITLPLPENKKLTVEFRVEPGCLGPSGKDHIENFCQLAQNEIQLINSDFVHWVIIPRYDKSLAEMQYKINNKNLNHTQAAKYLQLFNKNLDEFEEQLNEKLSQLIEHYLDNR